MELNVNVKSVSGKKNRITTIPIFYSQDEMTVRELIEETVQFCVSDYNKRKENGELLRALLPQEIEDKATQGKISFGVIYGENDADQKKPLMRLCRRLLTEWLRYLQKKKKKKNLMKN